MGPLLIAELHRFRRWAIAALLLHLVVLLFVGRLVDLAQQPLIVYRMLALAYGGFGLLFGLCQIGSYRRPNAWLNLLHRPLPPTRIALALVVAATGWLLVVIVLPLLLLAAWQETMTARVVDARHLLLPLAAWLIAATGHVAGAYLMLADRRYSVFALVLLALPAFSAAGGAAALLLQAVVLLVLLALLLSAFRPDHGPAPRRRLPLLLTALATQAGLYIVLLVALDMTLQLGWIGLGSHPLNRPVATAGSATEATRTDGRSLLLAGLRDSDAVDAELWREQIAISEVDGLAPAFERVPQRHELGNPGATAFDDEAGVRWLLSHDDMRFHGHHIVDGRAAGMLGIDGDGPFTALPVPAAAGLLLAGDTLYRFDDERDRIHARLRLADGEVFAAAPAQVGDSLRVLSDRALYLFDLRGSEPHDLLSAPQRLPLPGPIGNLYAVDLLQLLDGWLVSYTFLRWAHGDSVEPHQVVQQIDAEGRVTEVGRRDLLAEYPPLYRHLGWWLSPGWHAVVEAARGALATPDPLQATAPPPRPAAVIIIAAVLLLGSLGGAIWLAGRRDLPAALRGGWIVAAAMFGLPALLALVLLHRVPERQPRPATAPALA